MVGGTGCVCGNRGGGGNVHLEARLWCADSTRTADRVALWRGRVDRSEMSCNGPRPAGDDDSMGSGASVCESLRDNRCDGDHPVRTTRQREYELVEGGADLRRAQGSRDGWFAGDEQ